MICLEYPVGRVLYRTPGWISHIRIAPDGKSVGFLDHPFRGELPARVVGLCLPAIFMGTAGRVTEVFGQIGNHLGSHTRIDRRSRGIIQIKRKMQRHDMFTILVILQSSSARHAPGTAAKTDQAWACAGFSELFAIAIGATPACLLASLAISCCSVTPAR